jgi:hypothetical protein
VILIAGGLWLAHALSAQSKLQDCLMSGRTNCNVIESPPRDALLYGLSLQRRR